MIATKGFQHPWKRHRPEFDQAVTEKTVGLYRRWSPHQMPPSQENELAEKHSECRSDAIRSTTSEPA